MRRILGLTLVFILAGGSAFAAVENPGAARLEYGYLCTPEAAGVRSNDDSVSGIIEEYVGHPGIKFRGTQIPAMLGVSFGAKVQSKPEYAGPVTIVVTHPPLGADGVTRESWAAELPSDQFLYVGYGLSEPWELVTGDWTLSAISQGRVMFQIGFELVDPARLAEGAPICGAAANSS